MTKVFARVGDVRYILEPVAGGHEIPPDTAEMVGVPSHWWREPTGEIATWPKPAAGIELVVEDEEVVMEFKPDRGDTMRLAEHYAAARRGLSDTTDLVAVAQRLLDWQAGKDERALGAFRTVLSLPCVYDDIEVVLAEADKIYGWLQGNSDGD